MDHAKRSAEVAWAVLEADGYPVEAFEQVVECIANHHNGRTDKSFEAQLLSDADALDYLGAVGVLREFSTKPRELRKAVEGVRNRIARLRTTLILDASRRLAEPRFQEMEPLLRRFEEECFGFY